ncbi:MAG: hypothetical protein ACE14T_05335 [Syntrophales bacterium]
MGILEWINPLEYYSPDEYTALWLRLFSTVFQGFWGRFFALTFILFAFYLGVRRQKFQLGLWFILMAAFIVYGAAVLRFFNLM